MSPNADTLYLVPDLAPAEAAPSLRSVLAADFARYGDAPLTARRVIGLLARHQGIWAVLDHRFGHWVRSRGRVSPALHLVSFVLHKVVEIVTGISVSASAQIGPGLRFAHFGGIIVGPHVRLGSCCTISQGVTIGESVDDENRGSPTAGDCVFFGPGAKVFGPITIGRDTRIGANAVVHRDVPAHAVAVGVPARVVKIRGERVSSGSRAAA